MMFQEQLTSCNYFQQGVITQLSTNKHESMSILIDIYYNSLLSEAELHILNQL